MVTSEPGFLFSITWVNVPWDLKAYNSGHALNHVLSYPVYLVPFFGDVLSKDRLYRIQRPRLMGMLSFSLYRDWLVLMRGRSQVRRLFRSITDTEMDVARRRRRTEEDHST